MLLLHGAHVARFICRHVQDAANIHGYQALSLLCLVLANVMIKSMWTGSRNGVAAFSALSGLADVMPEAPWRSCHALKARLQPQPATP